MRAMPSLSRNDGPDRLDRAAAAATTSSVPTFIVAKRVALLVPPTLIISMYYAFRYATHALGFPLGYLVAFVIYWVGWCGAVPAALLGPRQVAILLKRRAPFRHLDGTTRALLLWPIAFPLWFAFIPRVGTVTVTIFIVSMVLGFVIGVTEEILWRGVYVTLFAQNVWLASVYPSIAFALWHVCPLSVLPSRYPGGVMTFAAYSIALGLSYAYVARHAHSIFWCTLSHCVHDALGLGGFAYARWFT
jgi:uncharacterized protein